MTGFLRWLTFALCLPFPSGRGAAQVAPLIANVNARQATSLDGQWQAIVDLYDVGALDYRAQPLKNNHAFYKNYKPQSQSELVEYDFDTSSQLHVPGDWNTQRESLLFYEGTVRYKRAFDYTKSPKNRLFLHFGACNYLAAVYLNELPHENDVTLAPMDVGKRRARQLVPYGNPVDAQAGALQGRGRLESLEVREGSREQQTAPQDARRE